MKALFFLALLLALPVQAQMPKPAPEMKALLDALASLKPKPIEHLRPVWARKQPGFPQAIKAMLQNRGQSTAREPVAQVVDQQIPGPAGSIPVRVYTPEGEGPFPITMYFHGGGWVIASIDAYDASARALANASQSVVVSVGYRLAPEHKYPAAHEDSYAATQFVMANAAKMNGDPTRVAVAGESAGGNLAAAVCHMARDRGGKMPIHQLLVYPIADYSFDTPSYWENAEAKPLNRPMMKWFFSHYLRNEEDGWSPYVSVLQKTVKKLPPATIVLAEIDPLRSEGEALHNRLRAGGVEAEMKLYKGVTHEFFGAGAVLPQAKEAVAYAGARLQSAFGK